MAESKQASPSPLDHIAVRRYYNRVYHRDATAEIQIPRHLRRLALRFQPWKGRKLLDVACGTGGWLRAATELGAIPTGIDISWAGLEACRKAVPEGQLYCGAAEHLPFKGGQFDFVSCLGALEHFLNVTAALREIVRVAKPDGAILLLVPNADFLPRRLGLYSGTEQTAIREEVRALESWNELFESAGLRVKAQWKDLHVLSPGWIVRGPWYGWPIRAAQALALPFWPLAWQYQVYHVCKLR